MIRTVCCKNFTHVRHSCHSPRVTDLCVKKSPYTLWTVCLYYVGVNICHQHDRHMYQPGFEPANSRLLSQYAIHYTTAAVHLVASSSRLPKSSQTSYHKLFMKQTCFPSKQYRTELDFETSDMNISWSSYCFQVDNT